MSTRTLIALTLSALALFAPRSAHSATWEIDPAHTSVQFAVRHMMVSNVRGEFTKVKGRIQADEADPTAARIEASIETASVDTNNEKRDDHLRGPDFLDAAKFPTISFASKKVEKTGESTWKIIGDLTLHGVTREVVLDMEGPTSPRKDPMGAIRSGAQARTKINRQDFGISFNKALDGGGLVVGNEVQITIDVEVVRASEAR